MARISEAIGYDVEVSEPNGPAVHGYITSRWADSLQPEFDRWLAEHDREVAMKILYAEYGDTWVETYLLPSVPDATWPESPSEVADDPDYNLY